MKKAFLILSMLISVSLCNAASINPRIKADSVLICVSNTGHKYHAYMCRGLVRCTHEIRKVTKTQAIKMGYSACKICY